MFCFHTPSHFAQSHCSCTSSCYLFEHRYLWLIGVLYYVWSLNFENFRYLYNGIVSCKVVMGKIKSNSLLSSVANRLSLVKSATMKVSWMEMQFNCLCVCVCLRLIAQSPLSERIRPEHSWHGTRSCSACCWWLSGVSCESGINGRLPDWSANTAECHDTGHVKYNSPRWDRRCVSDARHTWL